MEVSGRWDRYIGWRRGGYRGWREGCRNMRGLLRGLSRGWAIHDLGEGILEPVREDSWFKMILSTNGAFKLIR